jgi:Domain of unknown function (DUF4296)
MRRICVIALLAGLMSCSEAPTSKQKSAVLDNEKFTDVLVDVRLLEASYATHYARVDSAQALAGYYERLFQKHETTEEQFMESYRHYAARQADMRVIEDSVVARLTRMNR